MSDYGEVLRFTIRLNNMRLFFYAFELDPMAASAVPGALVLFAGVNGIILESRSSSLALL